MSAVAAYNIDKFRQPGEVFHPRAAAYLGFVVELDGQRVYHAGDTDAIPEMREVRCDVALLPVSGTYVMTADEAVAACESLAAAMVVPMHYGDIVGSAADAARLQQLCKIPVTVLPLEGDQGRCGAVCRGPRDRVKPLPRLCSARTARLFVDPFENHGGLGAGFFGPLHGRPEGLMGLRLEHIGEAVVAHEEDLGADGFAGGHTGATIVVDADSELARHGGILHRYAALFVQAPLWQ